MTIELRGVSKVYQTGHGPASILNDVDLIIEPGERVGILGQNGAGKSTLIRILGGSERPTEGEVRRGMSVSWPLAFGGAFLGALTGIDNVRFVCRLYGVDPEDRLPFIREFTELGRYLREPVKTYSSGMRARLAFAVSMAIDFDCYLVDEIIAVGDDRFQRKCQFELFERRRDKAMLIVSHSADFVRQHCGRASVLTAGKLTSFNDVEEAYRFYSAHEFTLQPHMSEKDESRQLGVHLVANPVEYFTDHFVAARTADEFEQVLSNSSLHRVPVFDSCDVVGRLESSGQKDAAMAIALFLTKEAPAEPLFWITLGDLLSQRRQHLQSVHAYEKAIELDADSYWARRNLANELFNVGRYAEAIGHYEKAIAAASNDAGRLELQLRWVDCHFLLDRLDQLKLPASLPAAPCTVIDKSGVVISGSGGGRFFVSGIIAEGIDPASIQCKFRVGENLLEGRRVYARGSIRRLASVSAESDFAFVAYAKVPDAVGAFDIELLEGDKPLYEVSHPIRSISQSTIESDNCLDTARRAYAEHHYEQSVIYFALSEDAGTGSDIVDFAESLIAIGLYDEAEWRLNAWFAMQASEMDSAFVLDLLCSEIARSRLPGWRRVIDQVLSTKVGLSLETSILANKGHAYVEDGNLPNAVASYSKASRLNAGRPLIHFARGIHTAQLALEVDKPEIRPKTWNKKAAGDIVHLFACDGGYFKRFAEKLTRSSHEARGEAKVIVHAHIVDGDDECRQLADRLGQSFGLRVSWESMPAVITNTNIQRAYFTCARFLQAPAILDQYRCPVLITETDCLINWTWSDIIRYSVGSDTGYLQSALTNWVPWTKIPAGVILFAPSECGIAYSKYIASFIEEAFARFGRGSADLWTVDQVALWLAHMNAPKSCKTIHLPMSSLLTLATGDKLNI